MPVSIVSAANSDSPDPEPAAKEQEHCSNCGALVTTKFCGECGQQVGHEGESLRDLIVKEASGADRLGTLATTIVWLLFRPGELILEFLAGRRARFIRPTQLYSAVAGCYLLLFTLSQPLQVDLAMLEQTVQEVKARAPEVAERLEGRDLELIRDRFLDRVNLVFPIITLLSIPLYVLLFRILFGPDWRRHTTTVIYFFSLAWLIGIATLPVQKLMMLTGSTLQLVLIFAYWAIIQRRVYPGKMRSDGRPRFRIGAYLAVLGADLIVTVLQALVSGAVAFALCLRSFR